MARGDLAGLDEGTVEETKYNDSFSASKVQNKNTWLRAALGEIDGALGYFYKSDPFYDCSVKTKQKSEMKHEEKKYRSHLVHSNTWPVEATETYLV